MRDQRFADLVGGKPIRWERPFFFFAALFASDLIWLELAPNIDRSVTGGYSISFLDIGDPSSWLTAVVGDLLITILVCAAFRLIPNEFAALAIVAIVYPLGMLAADFLMTIVVFGAELSLQLSLIGQRLVNSFGYAVCLIGSLVVALRLFKSNVIGLLLGAPVGYLLAALVYAVSGRLIAGFSDSPLITIGYLPVQLFSGFLFGVVFWLELRLAQTPPQLAEPRLRKSLYAGVWAVAVAIFGFLSLNTMLLITIGTWKMKERSEIVAALLLLGFAMTIASFAVVLFSRLIYKMWEAIQDGYARATPGRALGYLFIPLFNLFWAFQVFWGFAKDYNSHIARHGLNLRRLPEGLFLAYVILCFTTWIPFLGWLLFVANLIVGTIMIARICDAVSALPVAGAPANDTRGDGVSLA